MGTLRSTTDHSGTTVNGVLLGQPVELDDDPTTYEWDDSAFPSGEIDAEGNITPDEAE
jgi:YD repeat-containing protein